MPNGQDVIFVILDVMAWEDFDFFHKVIIIKIIEEKYVTGVFSFQVTTSGHT